MVAESAELRALRARLGASAHDWIPNPGPQTRFLECSATEALYGGAAGGGKTEALLIAALRNVHLPGYRALLLRRQFPELRRTLLKRAKEIYPAAGGRWVAGEKTWRFPSGATIELGSAPHESDIERFQGADYSFLGLDELTHFTKPMFTWMYSRMRSPTRASGIQIPIRIRATTNPGSVGHDWVLERYAPWLYPPDETSYDGPRARPGDVLWFRSRGGDSDEEVICSRGHEDATSRTFFPARVSDTPQLAGTGYVSNLDKLCRLDRKRLKAGDWMAREAAGEFFDRSWFEIIEAPPADAIARIRYWDMASTPARSTSPTSAYTAGLRGSIDARGIIYLEHMRRDQWSPGEVEKEIETYARLDMTQDDTMETILERDPAQAGKFQAWYYATRFPEIGIRSIGVHVDKLTRARLVSPYAEVGNIKIVRGRWNEPFLREVENFPDDTKDQVDTLSGIYRQLILRHAAWLRRAGKTRGRRRSGDRETSELRERAPS